MSATMSAAWAGMPNLAFHPSSGSPAPEIHHQEAPARQPSRLQLLGERAEGVGASGEAVDQQGRVLSVRIPPEDGLQVGGRVGHRSNSSL